MTATKFGSGSRARSRSVSGSTTRRSRSSISRSGCCRSASNLRRGMLRAALLATLALLLLSPAAEGAIFRVHTNDDGGSGSLREAIERANDDPARDRIVFDPDLTQTLALSRPLPSITSPLDIEGPGASKLTLYGGGGSGILQVNLDEIETVHVSGISIRGGRAASGGAITSFGADLALEHVVVSGNRATNSGGALNVAEGS